MSRQLESLLKEIGRCRICRDAPSGTPLQHEPRPVLRISATARIGIFGQAPGTRVHASGIPFTDPSGDRLRQWMGVGADEFYDVARVAIVPMGFCFPGLNEKGGDLAPRKECARHWRQRVMREMPGLEIALLVGSYAQNWHLGSLNQDSLSATVANWRTITKVTSAPQFWPLPHPSWRNNAWLKKNTWFEAELLSALRKRVRSVLG